MIVTPRVLLLVAALICFVIALLLELASVSGSDWQAWALGGFVAWVASQLTP